MPPVIPTEKFKEHSGESRDEKGKRLRDFVGPGVKLRLSYISIKAAARKEVPQSEKLLSPLSLKGIY